MSEAWREIPGFPGYEVSDLGRVRSLNFRQTGRMQALRLSSNGCGYLGAQIGGRRGPRLHVHRLVLLAFVGVPPTPDHEACHTNGDRADNRLENLRWGTRKENGEDKARHGTAAGERNGFARLRAGQVREMRRLSQAGATYSELGRRFGVHKSTARLVCLGTTWRGAC